MSRKAFYRTIPIWQGCEFLPGFSTEKEHVGLRAVRRMSSCWYQRRAPPVPLIFSARSASISVSNPSGLPATHLLAASKRRISAAHSSLPSLASIRRVKRAAWTLSNSLPAVNTQWLNEGEVHTAIKPCTSVRNQIGPGMDDPDQTTYAGKDLPKADPSHGIPEYDFTFLAARSILKLVLTR
jgi:hypothetical protein